MAAQYAIDLAHAPSYRREDFLIGESNRAACIYLDQWRQWKEPVTLLVGEAGSGKTHLAAIWQKDSGALAVEASRLQEVLPQLLESTTPFVVEDAGEGVDEEALFHLINHAKRHSALLITSSTLPEAWQINLPDLASRLGAAMLVRLATPDDELLQAIGMKMFSDRQLRLSAEVFHYLLRHSERSVSALRGWVERIDRAAMAEQREVTIPFIKSILTSDSYNNL